MTEWVVAAVLAASSAMLLATAVAFRADGSMLLRAGIAGRSAAAPRLPGSVRALAARVGSRSWILRLAKPQLLSARLDRAAWAVSLEELVGAKALAALGMGLLALSAPWPAPLLSPVLAAAGFRLPDVALAGAARRRLALANQELPQLLDLLAAASSAGLSGPLALSRAVRSTQGPLAEELTGVLRSVELGGRWRDELRKTAERVGLPDLQRAVAALTRTEALGTSLSEAVSRLAAQVRESRRAAAGERARTAPVKMLFPLVFLVLPAFLLLTVVPVLITTLSSIR